MTEMKMFVADIRSVARMDDHKTKRFCTVHYFNRKSNGELCGLHEGDNRVQMEFVLDVQGFFFPLSLPPLLLSFDKSI